MHTAAQHACTIAVAHDLYPYIDHQSSIYKYIANFCYRTWVHGLPVVGYFHVYITSVHVINEDIDSLAVDS